jgi:hypothetical protein
LRTFLSERATLEPELKRTLNRAIAETHQLHLKDVMYCLQGQIPRTTSGKTRRMASRDFYLSHRNNRTDPLQSAPLAETGREP